MLFMEIIPVFCDNQTKLKDTNHSIIENVRAEKIYIVTA
jgi:hypothetical protein